MVLGSEFEDTVPPSRLSRHCCYGFSQNGRIMKNRKRKRGDTRTTIQLVTFGYKGGVVSGLDRYYDLRRLPNDAWVIDGYKNKNGLDQNIRNLVLENEKTRAEYMKIKEDICTYITDIKGSRSVCVIGIGCKSGLHRSVTFAEKLHEELTNYDACNVWDKVAHLDIDGSNLGTQFIRRSDDSFICVTCNNLKCNDAKQMNEHLRSKKHKKRLAKYCKSRKKRGSFHNDEADK